LRFPKTQREARTLMAGLIGLAIALACQSASAALVVGDAAPFLVTKDDNLLRALANQVLASAESAGVSQGSNPDPVAPQQDKQRQPRLQSHDGVLSGLGTGCASSCTSQGTGSGWSGFALASMSFYVPQFSPGASLPGEAKTVLPTGPPFELLRPPRTTV